MSCLVIIVASNDVHPLPLQDAQNFTCGGFLQRMCSEFSGKSRPSVSLFPGFNSEAEVSSLELSWEGLNTNLEVSVPFLMQNISNSPFFRFPIDDLLFFIGQPLSQQRIASWYSQSSHPKLGLVTNIGLSSPPMWLLINAFSSPDIYAKSYTSRH